MRREIFVECFDGQISVPVLAIGHSPTILTPAALFRFFVRRRIRSLIAMGRIGRRLRTILATPRSFALFNQVLKIIRNG